MDFSDEINNIDNVFSVAGLTREIKLLLEDSFPPLWLQGEISNFVHHSSGHMYFTLKDEEAQIACVLWRARNASLFFTPQDGLKVLAHGSVRVYEKRGNYQFDITRMMPAGVGDLQMAFEQLKNRLREEGLFDEQFKKPLPEYPRSIGIVTSPTGAAIHDMVQILRRRFPAAKVILRPALVQGEGAAEDIAKAIAEFNRYGKVDVLIVGRGGGSLEDLWAFNEEVVARAIFESQIPVVSAVGHEVDFTISDFVADLRAPTPSAAAEMVVPDRTEILQRIGFLINRCRADLEQRLEYSRERLQSLRSSYGLRRPLDRVLQHRQRLDEIGHLAFLALKHQLDSSQRRLQQTEKRLLGLGPESILRRGYSICRRDSDKQIIRNAADLKPQDEIGIHFFQGGIGGIVTSIDPEEKI
jgi:exodeoxyribonuclease VII large subunit